MEKAWAFSFIFMAENSAGTGPCGKIQVICHLCLSDHRTFLVDTCLYSTDLYGKYEHDDPMFPELRFC